MPTSRLRAILVGVLVAAAYVAAARLGFTVAVVAEQVTTVWAPTGIAQAVLLLWGPRFWPAIWAGAFLANAGSAAPIWTAGLIASGNTLEAVAAARLLRPTFDASLGRFADAARFIVIAALFAPVLSATIGVTTLCAAGEQPWTRLTDLWSAWWLGDALGALVVAPTILTTIRRATDDGREYRAGPPLLLIGSLAAATMVFGGRLGPTFGDGPLHYVMFPFVIVAAVRYGQPTTAILVLGVSTVSILYTALGTGPFAAPGIGQGLILLQTFMGVLAGTGLLLAAALSERLTSQQRRSAAHAVGEVLADAPDLARASPAILKAVCEHLGWQVGALWLADHEADRLTCAAVWTSGRQHEPFEAATRAITFPPGVGLPGRVWTSGQAAWIEDVVGDRNFPRAPAAREANLHGAFGLPIRLNGEVLGVLEFFTRRVAAVDQDLLDTMTTLGNQVGQFIGRKRFEFAVSDEQRRTRAILDTALDAVISMDHRGILTAFNPAAERMFGFRSNDVIGRELADALIPTDLRERHRTGLARYLVSGDGPFLNRRVETRGLHADGHEFPIEVAITTITDEAAPRFTGFVRDLTDRVRAERERAELVRANEERLKEADRRKDEFLAVLAHELRNPLAPIRTGLELVRLAGDDRQAIERIRTMMERQVGHMVRLIDDLLDVSRITSGKMQLQRRPARLEELVTGGIEANRASLDAGGLELVVDLPSLDRPLLVDATRFVQVISNLLNNAVKFTDRGGRITIQGLVTDHDAGGSELQLSVQDTGIGIAEDLLPRVFDLFTQDSSARRRPHAGLGIGLALAQRIVGMHGGVIEARSDGPDRGSEFTIRLPLVLADEEVPNAITRLLPPLRQRVLVVDDNADAADSLAALVQMLGADVRVAGDGAGAVACAATFAPEIVLLDIGLPDMDGYETCRRLRRDPKVSEAVIVAITGWGQEADKRRAAEAGFDAHLIKPADLAELQRLLSEAAARPRSGP